MAVKKTDSNTEQYRVPLEELLEAGCHFGHQSRRWHPKMAPYIWGERNGVHIIDLEKTQSHLLAACEKVKQLTREGKFVLFVGTKRQASAVIEEEAQKAQMPYVAKRWLGGTLTNWKQVKKSIERLADLETKRASGELEKYTKREQGQFDKEIARLNTFVGGLRLLKDLPAALFIIDIKREDAVVREAKKMGIPVFAIVDTNCDPTGISSVIPANDDAIWSIRLIVSKISEAIREGRNQPINESTNRPVILERV